LSVQDWEIFKDRKNGVAIVSDIESVRFLLKELASGFLLSRDQDDSSREYDAGGGRYRWYYRDGKVIYYGTQHPEEFDTMDTWKWKRAEYQQQREYRFAFLAASPMMKVDSVILRVDDPGKYIQEIHYGPDVTEAGKKELLVGAIAAELAGKIQDFDAHYKLGTDIGRQ
jgi:hypothetical protein